MEGFRTQRSRSAGKQEDDPVDGEVNVEGWKLPLSSSARVKGEGGGDSFKGSRRQAQQAVKVAAALTKCR